MKHLTTLTLLAFLLIQGHCAKILGVFPMSAHSHFTLGFVLMKELVERGHEVTMISPYPQKYPIKNYRDIDISSVIPSFSKNFKVHYQNANEMYLPAKIAFYYSMGYTLVNDTFGHVNVQKLLKSNETFDLVIVANIFNEAMFYFAHHFKAPLLFASTVGASATTNYYNRNPAPYSYVPYVFANYGPSMNFIQRINNMLISLYVELMVNFVILPKQNNILHKYIPNAPHVNELMKKVSIILLNSHPSCNEPVPIMPNQIEIGGYHIKPTGKLPKDIQTYLDNATEGAVYFCLGGNLKPSQFSQDQISIFVRSLSKLKQKVLWKFEADSIPNQPKNIKLIKWAPQQDILGHKNIKLFISHGGMLGSIEAVYFGVPVIGIPFFADQNLNIKTAVRKGHAIGIPIHELSEKTLTAALSEILTNDKYLKVAKKLSSAMRDRVIHPLDEAVYWAEYLMRHPNLSYFKSAALELNWIQYHMLDVMSVCCILVVLITCTIFKCFKLLLRTEKRKVE